MSVDSFRKRYAFKLLSNFIGFLAGLVVAAVAPRSLGPQQYGNFTFLSGFFGRLIGMFDASTSQAFYIKISQRQKEFGLIKFYWIFVLVVTAATALFVAVTLFFGKAALVWPNQQQGIIWMACFWGLLSWLNQIFEKMLDGYGLTVNAQKISMAQKIIKAVLILILFLLGVLNLETFFIYHLFVLSLMLFMWGLTLRAHGIPLMPREPLGMDRIKSYLDEFYTYSAPLVAFALAGFVFGVLDIWMLEKFAGSVQQGFYGLAFKIGTICFLFTSSMTPLLMREFSISFEQGDLEKMRYQFCRYIPLFFTITTITSVFLSVQASNVTYLFGGKEFVGASLTITLMTFYPIHQTYGQLSNSLLFATGKTKLHRNIGFIQMTITAILTYFLIAPKGMFGLDLGAFGLAIKMIIAQMFGVYVRLWFNTKYLGVSFLKFVVHNVVSVAVIGAVAYASSKMVDMLIPGPVIITFLVSGIVYLLLTAGMIYLWPSLLGMSRPEFSDKVNQIKLKFIKS